MAFEVMTHPPAGRPAGAAMIDRAAERDSLRRTVAAVVRYRVLLKHLVAKDLKLKYRGSALGFIWSLLNPLLMIAVYTIAFTYILRTTTPGFVFYLMLGLLPWTFFVNATIMSAGAIVDNAGLVKSVFFPRAILPLATVLFNFAQYLLTVLVFLPLMLWVYGTPLSPPMLVYPVFLGLQLLFTVGVALVLATATTFFRDVRHFIEIGLAALFWVTPVVYQFEQIGTSLRPFILLTPMAPYIVAYQTVFFYRQWPDAEVWGLAIGYAIAALGAGAAAILAFEDRFPELI
jgi:ABC-2 type transport system permease protein